MKTIVRLIGMLLIAASTHAAQLVGYLDGTGEGTKWANGGGFYVFDGTRKEIGNLPSLPPPWTFTVWVKKTADQLHSASIVADKDSAIKLNVGGNTKFYVGFAVFADGDFPFTWRVPLREWHHLAFRCDGKTTTLFVDGVKKGIHNKAFSLPRAVIGGRLPGYDPEVLYGYLDDLMFWKGLLSDNLIETLWSVGPSTDP